MTYDLAPGDCVCPALAAFASCWAASDAVLPQLIDTQNGDGLTVRRGLLAADWLVRVHAPAWFKLCQSAPWPFTAYGLPDLTRYAAQFEACPEIGAFPELENVCGLIEAARDEAAARRDVYAPAMRAAWAPAATAVEMSGGSATRYAALAALRATDESYGARKRVEQIIETAFDAALEAAWAACIIRDRSVLYDTTHILSTSAATLFEKMLTEAE